MSNFQKPTKPSSNSVDSDVTKLDSSFSLLWTSVSEHETQYDVIGSSDDSLHDDGLTLEQRIFATRLHGNGVSKDGCCVLRRAPPDGVSLDGADAETERQQFAVAGSTEAAAVAGSGSPLFSTVADDKECRDGSDVGFDVKRAENEPPPLEASHAWRRRNAFIVRIPVFEVPSFSLLH